MPLRSSYARFNLDDAQCEWRRLETAVKYSELPNQHALIGQAAPILISMFHAVADPESSMQRQEETRMDVKAVVDHG